MSNTLIQHLLSKIQRDVLALKETDAIHLKNVALLLSILKDPTLSANTSNGSSKQPPPIPKRPSKLLPQDSQIEFERNYEANQMQLDFSSGWYKDLNMEKLKSQLPSKLARYSYQTKVSGNNYYLCIDIMHSDLSMVLLDLQWSQNQWAQTRDDGLVVKKVTSPPPRLLSVPQLIECHEKLGLLILDYCFKVEGTQVGTGICQQLVDYAMNSVPNAFKRIGNIHGFVVFSTKDPSKNRDTPRPGDIIHIVPNTSFKRVTILPNGGKSWHSNSYPEPGHVSIIKQVLSDGSWIVFEQNVNNVLVVVQNPLDLKDMVSGALTVYRPVYKEWIDDRPVEFKQKSKEILSNYQ